MAAEGFPSELLISPPDERAGDLTRFMRPGFGLGGPAVILPYGGPAGDYYGFDPGGGDPIHAAPRTESNGGAIYFRDGIEATDVDVALKLLGVSTLTDYAVFATTSAAPGEDNCLDQLRLVSAGAMRALFDPAWKGPDQTLDMRAAVHAFLAAQRAKWKGEYPWSEKLAGLMGGDGDWAKESLAFGLAAENTSWGVFRVWSRAWLVTK